MIMDSKDYDKKAHVLLDEENAHALLEQDPTSSIERKLLSTLKNLKKQEKITDKVYDHFRPSEGSSKPARFHGL